MPKLNKQQKKIIVSVSLLALILIVISVWNLRRQGFVGDQQSAVSETIAPPEVLAFRHPLTGQKVAVQQDRPAVYAVMVENSADAWPQSGVDQAFQVMEAPTEGRIPRLLTFYSADQTVEKIGPVRSARPYYIDWASAYGALYAHVGGSPDALETLKITDTVFDLNEFFHQYQFWRAHDRFAPHNVYTSTDLLARGRALRYADALVPEYGLMTFKDDALLADRPELVSDLVVVMGDALYQVTWKYDREQNVYLRFENTDQHLMQNGNQLTAKTIAVIATDMTTLDAIGRLAIETLGEGQGLLMQDGVITEVTWKKPSATEVMRFYDQQGAEVAVNAGQMWVEVVEGLDQVK